jgi:hypothetical protein
MLGIATHLVFRTQRFRKWWVKEVRLYTAKHEECDLSQQIVDSVEEVRF